MKIEEIRTENLNRLIKEYGTQTALADAIGIRTQQINAWVNHSLDTRSKKPKYISGRSCRKIEAIIGLHDRWFDTDHNKEEDNIRYRDALEIQSIDTIPLYKRPAWDAVHDKGQPIKYIGCVSEGYSKGTYALECLNDSLMDINNKVMIRKSDIVIIDPERKPHDGSYVLATSSKYKLVALKIYKVQDSKKFLYTPNPDWQEKWIRIDDTIQLHGTVIEVIKIVEN